MSEIIHPDRRNNARAAAQTLAAGAAGGLLFIAAGIPGGPLSGAVIAVAILAGLSGSAVIPAPLRTLAIVAMGVAIGSAVGPGTFANLAQYPGSVALACLSVVIVTLVSAAIWRWMFGWPLALAVLSSVPGSSGYIVSLSMTMGADAARIAVVQMSRLIFLVTLLPFFVARDSGAAQAHAPAIVLDPLSSLPGLLAAGYAGGAALTRIGLSGGMMLGAITASGAMHYYGLAPGRSPAWFLDAGQILLGSWVGSRFAGFDWKLFRQICIGAVLTMAASMAIIAVCALLAGALFGVGFGTALIAYAPGGQDAMMVLAMALGADPIFVSVNHLSRYFFINLSLPFVIARLRRIDAGE